MHIVIINHKLCIRIDVNIELREIIVWTNHYNIKIIYYYVRAAIMVIKWQISYDKITSIFGRTVCLIIIIVQFNNNNIIL